MTFEKSKNNRKTCFVQVGEIEKKIQITDNYFEKNKCFEGSIHNDMVKFQYESGKNDQAAMPSFNRAISEKFEQNDKKFEEKPSWQHCT